MAPLARGASGPEGGDGCARGVAPWHHLNTAAMAELPDTVFRDEHTSSGLPVLCRPVQTGTVPACEPSR